MKIKETYMNYSSSLTGEYKAAFGKIETYSYVGEHAPNEDRREDMLMQLVDSFLEAQRNETPVEQIIGNDLEAFCKTFYTKETAYPFIKQCVNTLRNIMICVLLFSGMDLISTISAKKNIFETMDNTIGILVIAACLSAIVTNSLAFIARRNIFRWKWLNWNWYAFIQ